MIMDFQELEYLIEELENETEKIRKPDSAHRPFLEKNSVVTVWI